MKRKYCFTKKVKTTQLLGDRCYYDMEILIRNRLHNASQFMDRLELETLLEGHQGCVNCLEWSENGRLLASASDDFHVMIWDAFRHKRLVDITTPHAGNIFSVKFMPETNNSKIITGAADCKLYQFDVERSETPIWSCNCHLMRIKRLATVPDSPHLFWSSGEDGLVLQFDSRERHVCRSDNKILLLNLSNHIHDMAEIKCIALNPRRPEQIAVGANDTYARVYDRRMITLNPVQHSNLVDSENELVDIDVHIERSEDNSIPEKAAQYYCPGQFTHHKYQINRLHKAITYLTFSPNGQELLVNMGSDQIYIYNMDTAIKPVFLNLPKTDELLNATNNKPIVSDEVANLKLSGKENLENEKYLQAINQYTMAIELAKDYPVLYFNRAMAYMRRNWYGDIYAALRDCHIALHLDPNYMKAHFRLARALLELGHPIEANDCLIELRKRFPNNANNDSVKLLQKDIDSLNNTNKSHSPELIITSVAEKNWRKKAKDYCDRFVGHCNTTTDIKEANYFGKDGNYIVAGSDDGNIFIWERPTNIITSIYKGDSAIVNCVQPHPYVCMLATSGIDQMIRLWSPQPVENYESKNKIAYCDGTVTMNQQRMQMDPFDFSASSCRTS